MAVTYAKEYNGMYCGTMSEDRIKYILNVRGQQEVEGFKQMLFDFPPEMVYESLTSGESIRNRIIREQGDFSKYYGTLRGYQTVGAAFMYLSPRSIIGDGVGAGKTVEISALINYLKGKGEMKRFLIAVETSALGQTQCELIRFTGLNIIALPSEAAKMRKVINNTDWNTVDGVVIKHSALRSDVLSTWLSLYIDNTTNMSTMFDTFFLDESSVIKNRGTKMFTYTENICNIVRRVHFMNATAFETCIMDIYNQMDMMNGNLLPKKWRIEKEYCTYGQKKYWTKDEDGKAKLNFARDMKGYKNQEKFKESLKLVYFGRSKKEIGKELPHTYKVYEIEPTTEQCMAINKGHRYSEVLNCPSNIENIGFEFNRKMVPKLDRLIQLVETEFKQDKVMIYCFHINAQKVIKEELEKIGRNPIILNGECVDEERNNAISAFNNGDKDVIITNIQKSLNLYGGDVCIFYSMVGNPAKMEQVRGRIDRSVDDKLKTFVLLLYKYTDEYKFFTDKARQRAEDSRELTIDAKTAVDFFIDAMELDN